MHWGNNSFYSYYHLIPPQSHLVVILDVFGCQEAKATDKQREAKITENQKPFAPLIAKQPLCARNEC